eukprot:gene10074-2495_t
MHFSKRKSVHSSYFQKLSWVESMTSGKDFVNINPEQQPLLQQEIIKNWTFEIVKLLYSDLSENLGKLKNNQKKSNNGNLTPPDFSKINEVLDTLEKSFKDIKFDPIIYVVGLFYFDYLLSKFLIPKNQFEVYLIICISLGSKIFSVFEDEFYPNSYFYKKLFINNQNILYTEYNQFEVKILNLMEYNLFIDYETLKKFIDYYSELVSGKVVNKISNKIEEPGTFRKNAIQKSKGISKLKRMSSLDPESKLEDTMKNQENFVEYFLLYELVKEYQDSTTQKGRIFLLDKFFNEFVEKYPKMKSFIAKEYLHTITSTIERNEHLKSNLLDDVMRIFENTLEMKFEKFKSTKIYQESQSPNSKIPIPKTKMEIKKAKSRSTSLIQASKTNSTISNFPESSESVVHSPMDKIEQKTSNPLHLLDLFGLFKKK